MQSLSRTQRDKEKSFYRLPSILIHQGTQTESLSRERQQAWLAKIKREDILPEQYYNIRVCSDHFVSGTPSKLYDVTNPDWAPSLKLVYEKVSKRSLTSRSERYDRAVKRRRLCLQELMEKTATEEEELENEDIELDLEIDVTTVIPDNYHSIAVQTNNSFDMIEQNFQHEIEELKRENETLKQAVNQLESELEG